MSRLLAGTVILEGITHIEDLPLEKFLNTVENLKDKIATEKLDGANLWMGVDENGFFTSREGKSKRNARFYKVEDFPMVASYNGFRAAHLALEQVKSTITKVLQPGDMVELEILFGRQPNTVTYGADDLNYIVILRGIGTDTAKVDLLAKKLDNTTVNVNSTVISSPDGDELQFDDEQMAWEFTQVKPIDNSKINSSEAGMMLGELKAFLKKKNEAFPEMTNQEVAEVKLGSVPKDEREAMKKERELVLAAIMANFKMPIKEILLNNYVRNVKPKLQARDLDPSEDVGMEGVVLRDKDTDDQVKLVDKDVFTAINTFNNFIRSNVSGLVRTDDQDAPIELRGGAFGQAKIRIAQLLGIRELAVSSTSKKTLEKFKGGSPEETAEKLGASINVESFQSVKTKIQAILNNALEEVDTILSQFKNESESYKLKLKTGKEIGLSPEIVKRNLTAFAETKRDIRSVGEAVGKAESPAQLVAALYGKTIQSLFNGSNDVKESFSLLKQVSEDGEVAGVPAPPTTPSEPAPGVKADSIANNPQRLFDKNIVKRKRNYVPRKRFAKPTNESLIKLVEFDVMNQNATDVDDKASAQNDIEFKSLRNNVTMGDDVTDLDVTKYLNKAHELNDEVDTITFGMELDDGSIVKVYVNANQADGFEAALSQMLGEYDDVEDVIDQLASTFDIVDVEWPQNMQPQADTVDVAADQGETDGAAVVDSNADGTPPVNPVIDLGNAEEMEDEPSTDSDDGEDGEDGEEPSIDMTVFGDDQDNDELNFNDAGAAAYPDAEGSGANLDTESDEEEQTADEPDEPDETQVDISDDSTDDEIVGGEEATDDETPPDEGEEEVESKKKPNGDEEEEDEEDSDESTTKSKKKEESFMTIGQQFKAKLLAEKANKKPKNDKNDDKDQELDIAGLPANLEKLMQSFPTRGEKAMLVLLYALGAPVDALNLKKSEVRKTIDSSAEMFLKDSQFRLWVKRLTEELMKATKPMAEAALEDELGNAMQRVILEIMQKIGLPESVERLARAQLRNNVKDTAKIALTNSKVRQYIKIVAEMLGIDASTGTVKEAKNHMGEAEQTTYAGWKRAVKAKYPDVWFEGDKDIGQAMVGEKPFARGKTVAVGEWDGETGSVFNDVKLPVKEDAPVPGEDQTGNEWVDEIMKLAGALGIPEDILNYRRKQTELALKQSRTKMQNFSLVLRNIKKLNQIVGGNTK